jgi:hypothetical protein
MRPGTTTAILVGAAIVVYALLPGGLVALAGFELLILMAAWMAIRRITRTSVPEDDDARPSLWSWIPWSRSQAGKPAPPSLRRVEGLLRFSEKHAYTTNERLVPLLRRIAEDRLAAHHGIDPDTQPEKARVVLGDEAWLIISKEWMPSDGESDHGPGHASLAAAVDSIERV